MGWMFRKCSMQELIQDRLGYDCIEHERKVIAHALRGSVLWTVNQITHRETGASDVFIGCDLLRKDGEWCGYKDMEESMGPHHYSCPMKFLDMAPERNPVWRERVREYLKETPELVEELRQKIMVAAGLAEGAPPPEEVPEEE